MLDRSLVAAPLLACLALSGCAVTESSPDGGSGPAMRGDARVRPTPSEGGACETIAVAVQPAQPRVLVVLDRSGSMGGMRWTVATSSISGFVQALDDQVDFGLTFYPAPGEELTCFAGRNVVEPGPHNGDEIATALADPAAVAIQDRGYTPTSATLRRVREDLGLVDPDRAPSATFVVLVTDGLPNCRMGAERNADPDEEGAYAAIEALYGDGVPTYVVGYLTDAVAPVMDEMARRGGTERHHAVENAEQLRAALEEITDAIATCSFQLDTSPDDPSYVRVQVDGDDLNPADGDYALEGDVVQVRGAACDALRDGESHVVNITVECEPVILI